MTKQDQKSAADINKIMARFAQTGVVSHVNQRTPSYGDFSMASDLNSMLVRVSEAEDEFMTLPSAVRKAADNDPVVFLQMLATEEGEAVLIDAGLAKRGADPEKPRGGQPQEVQGAAGDGPQASQTPPQKPTAAPDGQTIIPGAE